MHYPQLHVRKCLYAHMKHVQTTHQVIHCQYWCWDIHLLFTSIFDFQFTIFICLQQCGISKDGSATGTTKPKQLPVHRIKTAGDPTTPVLGNPASETDINKHSIDGW